jgi:hypothetical protein
MGDAGPVSFLGRQLPDAFTLRVVTVLPGQPQAYQAAGWGDCLVVVESGELELEHVDGSRHRFGPGSLLTLDSMPLRWLHAAGPGRVLLSVVSRRHHRE